MSRRRERASPPAVQIINTPLKWGEEVEVPWEKGTCHQLTTTDGKYRISRIISQWTEPRFICEHFPEGEKCSRWVETEPTGRPKDHRRIRDAMAACQNHAYRLVGTPEPEKTQLDRKALRRARESGMATIPRRSKNMEERISNPVTLETPTESHQMPQNQPEQTDAPPEPIETPNTQETVVATNQDTLELDARSVSGLLIELGYGAIHVKGWVSQPDVLLSRLQKLPEMIDQDPSMAPERLDNEDYRNMLVEILEAVKTGREIAITLEELVEEPDESEIEGDDNEEFEPEHTVGANGVLTAEKEGEFTVKETVSEPRRRGRPKGSKNKSVKIKKTRVAATTTQAPRRPGRPAKTKPSKPVAGEKVSGRTRLSIKPGTVLEREYKDKVYKVTVLEDGRFQLGTSKYTSLTAAAKAIVTPGESISGPVFFGLVQRKKN